MNKKTDEKVTEKVTKEKTVHDLKTHELMTVETNIGSKIDILKVEGGWIYTLEYPGIQKVQAVFVPYSPLSAGTPLVG